MKKPVSVKVSQLGKVFVMPKTVVTDSLKLHMNARHESEPYLLGASFACHPKELQTVVSLEFGASEDTFCLHEVRDTARARVDGYLYKYNTGAQSFGWAQIRSTKTRHAFYTYLTVDGVLEKRVRERLATATVYLLFRHREFQMTLWAV